MLIIDDKALKDRLKKLNVKNKDLFAIAANSLKKTIVNSFDTSTDPFNRKWRDITHRQGKPLVDTGSLRNSIKTRITSSYAIVSTNKIYAKIQQFGGTIKPVRKKYLAFKINGQWRKSKEVTIHPRPYFPIRDGKAVWTPELESEIKKEFEKIIK